MARNQVKVDISGERATVRLPKEITGLLIGESEQLGVMLASPALRHVDFEFSDTELITSTAVGCLVEKAMACDGRGIQVAFNGAAGSVDRVLAQIGVYRRFPASRPGQGPS